MRKIKGCFWGWDAKRTLAKVNYIVHTDAVKEYLIPQNIPKTQMGNIYANEADILNMALFGKTAKEWKDENKEKEGNMRDVCRCFSAGLFGRARKS